MIVLAAENTLSGSASHARTSIVINTITNIVTNTEINPTVKTPVITDFALKHFWIKQLLNKF